MNRQYFQPKITVTTRTGDKDKKKGISCFRCGGNHRVRDCPDRQAPRSSGSAQLAEEAPFVCYAKREEDEGYQAMSCEEEETRKNRMTTAQAVDAGYGIIDGGATRTLGSTYALDAIIEENIRKRDDGGIIEVDTGNTPKFGFGNSSTDTCVSTAKLRITAASRPGVLEVHALDRGKGPVLLSISTLRALKAVIDFESDIVVFRGIDDKKAIKATRSQAGHQMLPLTDDLYRDAVPCVKPVPSLTEYLS